MVRTLSDMVMDVEGRKNECMGDRHWIDRCKDSRHSMLTATAR